jgi:hypothetical protein
VSEYFRENFHLSTSGTRSRAAVLVRSLSLLFEETLGVNQLRQFYIHYLKNSHTHTPAKEIQSIC